MKTQIKYFSDEIFILFLLSLENSDLWVILDFIDQHAPECLNYSIIKEPTTLIGKHIQHRFEVDNTGTVKWYHGIIITFDPSTNLHEIEYEGEEEHCYFDLTIDLFNGDIKVLDL